MIIQSSSCQAALAIDPDLLSGYWDRAWLFLGMSRWNDAAEAIRLAKRKDPANEKRAAILPIVEEIASAPNDAARWTDTGAAFEGERWGPIDGCSSDCPRAAP